MDELISRQAAIDALNALEKDGHAYVNGAFFETILRDEVKRVLEELPSAQPEIIRCKDCEYRNGDYCHRTRDGYSRFIHYDDFCSYGERRTDEQT